jgi:hypothetical protein
LARQTGPAAPVVLFDISASLQTPEFGIQSAVRHELGLNPLAVDQANAIKPIKEVESLDQSAGRVVGSRRLVKWPSRAEESGG